MAGHFYTHVEFGFTVHIMLIDYMEIKECEVSADLVPDSRVLE